MVDMQFWLQLAVVLICLAVGGRFVINHSFIVPGLIGVFSASIAGYILAAMYGFV